MINGELRPTFLKERGARLRSRLSATRIKDAVECWMHLATWLNARSITTLATCDSKVLHDYGQHLLSEHTGRANVERILGALTRLWAFDQLSAQPTGIGRPPWDELGADDYLPAATSTGGENATEPLAEQTMGPLLIWAMRMVDDFADDILAAWAEHQRLSDAARTNPSTPAGRAALETYLGPLIAAHAPLPTMPHKGKMSLARYYIAGLTGASPGQIQTLVTREGLVAAAAQRPGPCPLDLHFDSARFATSANESFYHIDSEAAAWNTALPRSRRRRETRPWSRGAVSGDRPCGLVYVSAPDRLVDGWDVGYAQAQGQDLSV
jgi:hypothetical protein